MFCFPLKEKKKKSICRNANEMFINATVTTPQLGGDGRAGGRKQKIQSVCNGAILTNVTKHAHFPEENPFLFITKLGCSLPSNHKSSSVLTQIFQAVIFWHD